MLNQFIYVGRLVEDPLKINDEKCVVKLITQRYFKNEEGIYESDTIQFTIRGEISKRTLEYCHKGSIMGVKGRFESNKSGMELIVEKVTFLSSPPKEEL